jgi:membrane protease subunit (stomatin/prohibitin family)
MRRFFFQYLVMFGVAVGLALAGANTGGVASTVLWIVAGLLFAVTLWSVLFMTVMQRLLHMIKRLNADA